MKKKLLLVTVLLIFVFVGYKFAHRNSILSSTLIYYPEKVDLVQILVGHDLYRDIKDKAEIEKFIRLLDDIDLVKMSESEIMAVQRSGIKDGYAITFVSLNQGRDYYGLKGAVAVFGDGNILRRHLGLKFNVIKLKQKIRIKFQRYLKQ